MKTTAPKTTQKRGALTMESPIGPLRLRTDGTSITEIDFDATPRSSDIEPDESGRAVLEEAKRQLEEYFVGERTDFDLPLAPDGTAFQRRVWDELLEIPYGETTSYGRIAATLGLVRGAARAVGLANGSNPIPIVVPCHRVIGADGSLTGYAGGLDRKRTLLSVESRVAEETLF